ncbi:hypothetical protein OCAE111667_20745 [Occultella aeris]|uniref:Uncharacterized protein n=1 Tax=Occultella aeris TaxID=2761496 RepID=A0A7M4DQ44_9MICO|nr:hypothetical protein [Occultella aeris]VZO39588.1 hypothetical protein HALOF300_04281 [Occultella aeris]
MSQTSPPTTARATTPPAPDRPTRWALLSSLVVALLTGWLLLRPDLNAFLLPDGALARAWLPGPDLTASLCALAAVGGLVALLHLVFPHQRVLARVVGPVAVIQVVAFAVLAQGSGTLSTFGYLVSLLVPLILVGLGIQVFRTRPAARIVVALVAVAVVVLIIIGRDVVATYAGFIFPALLAQTWSILAVLLTLGCGVAWAGVLVSRWSRTGSLRRATAWVTRYRRLFTALAALGPLPYALIRLTWLTPWPQLGSEQALDPAVRLQGLLLSSGAWLGFILTLGLIARWGEVFPRWFPVRAGQPVPPLFAIIPGATIALMLCGVAIPVLGMIGIAGAVVFPAWFWGPMLALAVWGYAGHRYGIDRPADLARVGADL